jgi:putative heme-binding domain-containing protein
VTYSLSIPDLVSESTIELAHDLRGVSAEWADARGEKKWSGWLPTPDLATARGFLVNSSSPERLARHLKYKGKLTLKFQLDLWNFLIPALQPGATLDFSPPPERITVHFESDADLQLQVGEGELERVAQNRYSLKISPREGRWVPVTLTIDSPASILNVYANTAMDAQPRVLQLSRFLMPFARPPSSLHLVRSIPEIAGGDWERGRTLFKEKATCNLCHQIGGEGFAVGPDLSNLKDRDYASVLRDITDPSATINPDAISYTVTLQDGTEFSGVRFGEDENALTLVAAGGILTKIEKRKIASRQPGKLSMMPTGLLENLSSSEVKDLMTFLLTPEPKR